jgi:hypothetical protein
MSAEEKSIGHLKKLPGRLIDLLTKIEALRPLITSHVENSVLLIRTYRSTFGSMNRLGNDPIRIDPVLDPGSD